MKSSNGGDESDVRVRVAAQITLPSALRRRCADQAQYVTPQRMALCGVSGVVAIANGPVVDLYLLDNKSTSAAASPSSSDDNNHDNTPVHNARDSAMRLPFLMQIALDEFKDIRGYAVQRNVSLIDKQSVMTATCVCFVAPGVLLVGAAKLQDNKDEAGHARVSTWLFGFRIYVSAPVHQRASEAFVKSARNRPHDPAIAQFSFLERIPISPANGIACMEVCRHCTTSQAGAVLLIMNESSNFAIFQWRERLSDRQVCVAEIPDCSVALTTAAISSDGRWCALSDAIGHLYLLNFEAFEWYGRAAELCSRDDKPFAARRLQNGSCWRSGIAMRDNPLDAVRLSLVSGGPEAQSVYSSLRWLAATSANKIRHFLLAGSQSGSLSVMVLRETQDAAWYTHWTLKAKKIFPSVSGQRYDPIRQICARFEASSVRSGFQIVSISDTMVKHWEVKTESASDNNNVKRLVWPSIKEYFEAPTISLSSGEAIEGLVDVSYASRKLWSLRSTSSCFGGLQSEEHADGWMVVILTEISLHLLAMESRSRPATSASQVIYPGKDTVRVKENEALSGSQSKHDTEGDEEGRSSPGALQETGEKRDVSVVTTIQEKYRLPHTSWQADSFAMPSQKENSRLPIAEISADNASPLAKQVRVDRKSKLPCAEYDQRVQQVAKRVERLGSNLKVLRNSFQLFTQDVQLHMKDVSEQLELAARLRHSRQSGKPQTKSLDKTTAP